MEKSYIALTVLNRMRRLYLQHPNGLSDAQMGEFLGLSRVQVWRHRQHLQTVIVAPGIYRYMPTDDDVELAQMILEAREKSKVRSYYDTE